MSMPEQEGKKAELVKRIDHFRGLVAADAETREIHNAFEEVARSLDGYTRTGRAQGLEGENAAFGERRRCSDPGKPRCGMIEMCRRRLPPADPS